MSIEAQVEELYGDSKEPEWKAEEVRRLKKESGFEEEEEPSVARLDGIQQISHNVIKDPEHGKAPKGESLNEVIQEPVKAGE